MLLLAAMPILAISVEVFGLASQSAITMVTIALVALLATLVTFAPHRIDMIVGRGLIAGMVACIVYDGARLFAVHVLGLMGDFIPVMGSFVTGEPDTAGSAAVGYVYRYLGDAGGLGVAFFVVAFALGIDRWKNVYAVLAAVGFAVFPTWAGLMATVALAPHGEERMFDLNTATVMITLVGHLIFGLFLGLAFLKAPRGKERSAGRGLRCRNQRRSSGPSASGRRSPIRRIRHAAAGRREFSTARGTHAVDHGPPLWVKIALDRRSHVFPPGSLEAVRTGAGPVERPTGDPRQGLDQCGVARARRNRLAAARHLGEPRFAWSIRDLGSRNGTYLNGEKITAERVLRSGDEVRVGKSRLLFLEVRDSGEPVDEATIVAHAGQLPPRLTRREVDVLMVLCRPLVSDDAFPEPASVRRMAGELFVTEAAVKQHLQNLYDKFAIPTEGDRRVRLANEALRRGAVTIAQLRDSDAIGEVEGLDGRDRTFVGGPVRAPDAVQGRADRSHHLAVNRSSDRRQRRPLSDWRCRTSRPWPARASVPRHRRRRSGRR